MRVDLTKSTSPFSRSEKLRRLVWTFAVWPLVRFIPRNLGSKLRIFALRAFGASIGKKCFIESGVVVWLPWRLQLIEFVAIGRDVEIYNYGWVRIGRMSVVSQYTYLCTGSHDYTDPFMPLIWRDVNIGSECWIGADVFVAPGVNINDGTVIGARSVVTKSMPAWKVCAGNPCRVIKERILSG